MNTVSHLHQVNFIHHLKAPFTWKDEERTITTSFRVKIALITFPVISTLGMIRYRAAYSKLVTSRFVLLSFTANLAIFYLLTLAHKVKQIASLPLAPKMEKTKSEETISTEVTKEVQAEKEIRKVEEGLVSLIQSSPQEYKEWMSTSCGLEKVPEKCEDLVQLFTTINAHKVPFVKKILTELHTLNALLKTMGREKVSWIHIPKYLSKHSHQFASFSDLVSHFSHQLLDSLDVKLNDDLFLPLFNQLLEKPELHSTEIFPRLLALGQEDLQKISSFLHKHPDCYSFLLFVRFTSMKGEPKDNHFSYVIKMIDEEPSLAQPLLNYFIFLHKKELKGKKFIQVLLKKRQELLLFYQKDMELAKKLILLTNCYPKALSLLMKNESLLNKVIQFTTTQNHLHFFEKIKDQLMLLINTSHTKTAESILNLFVSQPKWAENILDLAASGKVNLANQILNKVENPETANTPLTKWYCSYSLAPNAQLIENMFLLEVIENMLLLEPKEEKLLPKLINCFNSDVSLPSIPTKLLEMYSEGYEELVRFYLNLDYSKPLYIILRNCILNNCYHFYKELITPNHMLKKLLADYNNQIDPRELESIFKLRGLLKMKGISPDEMEKMIRQGFRLTQHKYPNERSIFGKWILLCDKDYEKAKSIMQMEIFEQDKPLLVDQELNLEHVLLSHMQQFKDKLNEDPDILPGDAIDIQMLHAATALADLLVLSNGTMNSGLYVCLWQNIEKILPINEAHKIKNNLCALTTPKFSSLIENVSISNDFKFGKTLISKMIYLKNSEEPQKQHAQKVVISAFLCAQCQTETTDSIGVVVAKQVKQCWKYYQQRYLADLCSLLNHGTLKRKNKKGVETNYSAEPVIFQMHKNKWLCEHPLIKLWENVITHMGDTPKMVLENYFENKDLIFRQKIPSLFGRSNMEITFKRLVNLYLSRQGKGVYISHQGDYYQVKKRLEMSKDRIKEFWERRKKFAEALNSCEEFAEKSLNAFKTIFEPQSQMLLEMLAKKDPKKVLLQEAANICGTWKDPRIETLRQKLLDLTVEFSKSFPEAKPLLFAEKANGEFLGWWEYADTSLTESAFYVCNEDRALRVYPENNRNLEIFHLNPT